MNNLSYMNHKWFYTAPKDKSNDCTILADVWDSQNNDTTVDFSMI